MQPRIMSRSACFHFGVVGFGWGNLREEYVSDDVTKMGNEIWKACQARSHNMYAVLML
jgi:hypothetical protein